MASILTQARERSAAAYAHATRVAPWYLWLTTLIAFGLAVWHAYETHPQFAPDSRHYVAKAYTYTGLSEEAAREAIAGPVEELGLSHPPVEYLFDSPVVVSRIVYPALSAPFLDIFGINGMLVVPFIAMLLLSVGVFAVIASRYSAFAATSVTLLFLATFYMMFFGTAMLTDGPAAGISFGILLTLPIWKRRTWVAVAVLAVLLVVLAYTRPPAIIPAGAIIFAYLGYALSTRTIRNRWLPFAAVAAAVPLLTRMAQAGDGSGDDVADHFREVTGAESFADYPLALARSLAHVIRTDLRRYINGDWAFLLLLGIAWLAAVLLIKRVEAHLFLGAMAGGAIINGLSTIPVSFRYEMPALPFLLLLAGAFVFEVEKRWRVRREAKSLTPVPV